MEQAAGRLRAWAKGAFAWRGGPIVGALLVGVVFLVLWHEVGTWREERDAQVLRSQLTSDLAVHRNALSSALANRFALLEGLRAFVEAKLSRGERLEDQYAAFAGRLYGIAPGTRNLAVAEGTVYRVVYPPQGNESVLGYDLLADPRPEVVHDVRRAMRTTGIVATGPSDLKQGGVGVVARGAVLKDGRFWGLVGIAFDLKPILDEGRVVAYEGGVMTAIRRPGAAPFFGPAAAFEHDPIIERVPLPGGTWEIAANPIGGWAAAGAESRRLWMLWGVVFALFPMTLVFAGAWRQRVLREAAADAERRVEEGTAALARTTELLQSVLRASPLPIIMLDGDGVVRVWNRAAEAVFGWTAEEAIGRGNPLAIGHEEEFRELQRRVRAGETLGGFEVHRRRKDGTPIELRLFTAPVVDPDGHPVGVMALAQDITEQAKIERALRLAMVVVENSPVMVVRWKPADAWRVEYVSENIRRFGYSPEDFAADGLLYDDIVLADDLPRVGRECTAAMDSNSHDFVQEYRIRTKDGRVRWMEDHTRVGIAADGSRTCEGIVLDITERRLAEDARREMERLLREMLDSVQLIAVMLDRDGRVTFCNRYLLELTGWTHDELIGRSWFETCLPAGEAEALRGEFAERIVAGTFDRRENAIVTKAGDLRQIAWDNTILRGPNGHPIGSASFGRDVTDQRQLEAQYRHAQKMEAVGQLAGGVAHDFNNLLQVITGYAALALGELTPDQPLYSEVDEIRHAAERATALVRQLLTFSRRQKIERRALDINETIANLLKMLRRLIGEHIELEFAPGYDVEAVLADAGLLEQVLMNLCVNARDVMPDGGRISIATTNVTLGPEFIEQRGWGQQGRYVLLSVSDTGPGIPPGLHDRIFEPFFTTKEIGKGTGLGLATVYGIVKQHEGMIEVARDGEPGATFRIYLPVAGCREERAAAPGAAGRVARGHETILLAEDEDLVRSLARRVLESAGYRVLMAKDGGEAIALVETRAGEIDLALLDVVMPKANGRDVSARLKEIRPEVPVLFSSGYSRQMLDENWIPDSGAELIPKPYEPKELLARVRASLAARA